MVVQNQSQMGEGLANPTDPHHTPTITQSSTQPQKTQKPGKPKRKDTQVPQPSDPSENVVDEAVHKELGDNLVRAATTTSSLEAEQYSGNITKTRSKATPNESSSLGTTSCGGPRCQETMGDTIVQTRVLDLEKKKTTQHNEIDSLKRRVKKLEKKDKSITHKLKRLYKFGLTTRVESSGDEEDLDVLNGEQVFVAGQNANVVEEVVDAAQVSTSATTVTITTEEITLAQALEALKTSKPKVKGIVFQEPSIITTISSQQSQDKGKGIMIEEPVNPMKKKDLIRLDEEVALKLQAQEQEELYDAEKATLFQQLLEKRRKHFAAKRAKEERNKPPTKAQQRQIKCTYLKNMEGYKLKDLNSKGVGEELIQESSKKKKVDDDKETTKIKQCMEIIPDEEEVTIDAILLAVKSPRIDDWKIHKEGKKSYYQIIRAHEKSQMYRIFSQMLKSCDREDWEDL
ncbi:hypothetical protein Tco_1300212 [Tanacetum coccineum]